MNNLFFVGLLLAVAGWGLDRFAILPNVASSLGVIGCLFFLLSIIRDSLIDPIVAKLESISEQLEEMNNPEPEPEPDQWIPHAGEICCIGSQEQVSATITEIKGKGFSYDCCQMPNGLCRLTYWPVDPSEGIV